MIIVDIKDSTQERILPHLAFTEQLIRNVGKKISGRNVDCEIIAMEDLGLSHNSMRMRGGFFTGILINWDFDVPFIPVDVTVNSCGVSIYTVEKLMSFSEFKRRVMDAKTSLELENVSFNYSVGNHFISFCQNDVTKRYYLVLHASDNAFKYGSKGLYPREDTWYYHQIKTEEEGNRYLRYIDGNTAEKFLQYYAQSSKSNPIRNDKVANAILKGIKFNMVLYTPHYGMPDVSSIAIGCQWTDGKLILLTSEGKSIYIVEEKEPKKFSGFPHGFGVTVNGACSGIDYLKNNMRINSIDILADNELFWEVLTKTRYSNKEIDDQFIVDFLSNRNIVIIDRLQQLYSYSATGFHNFKDGNEYGDTI